MEKLNFEQFKEEVKNKIKDFLPEDFKNASIKTGIVKKNNGLKLTELQIFNENSNICPAIYLEPFYKIYQSDGDLETVLKKMVQIRLNNDVNSIFDTELVLNFEKVKGSIIPCLLRKDWNEQLLAEKPYKTVADLAITYRMLLVETNINNIASIPITNDLMNVWHVDIDTLHELALQNMSELLPSTLQSISSAIEEEFRRSNMGDGQEVTDVVAPKGDVMYVLSNKQRLYGAAAVLDKEIMQKILDRFGENFYIIPSSINECIILTSSLAMSVKEATDLIKVVNATHVVVDERLSDHLYRYSAKDGLTSI